MKCCGQKIHWTDSHNRDIIGPSGRELYHLQFSLQADSPETFGYTLLSSTNKVLLDKMQHFRYR